MIAGACAARSRRARGPRPDGKLLGRAAQALDHGEISLAEPCAFPLTDVEQALQTVLACTGTTPVVVRVANAVA